jgi:hypothetical protein
LVLFWFCYLAGKKSANFERLDSALVVLTEALSDVAVSTVIPQTENQEYLLILMIKHVPARIYPT